MDFRLGKKEETLRKEIAEFAQKELPPGWIRVHLEEDAFEEEWEFVLSISKKLAQKGWLTMSWPKEQGGLGASLFEQLVYREEAGYWSIPGVTMGVGGIDWVGPGLIQFGSEELKQKHLPLIASGGADGVWCTGYSEPDAGSDFASIRTGAVKKNGKYIINGQKIWTSAAHKARWLWLAAVTDPDAPSKHDGISIFAVDMKSEGLTVRPLVNYAGYHIFNELFFDNVEVPEKDLIGVENRGWYQLMHSLAHERSSIGPMCCGLYRRLLELLVEYTTEKGLFEDRVIQHKLADSAIDVEILRLFVYQTIWKMNTGERVIFEPSRDKVFTDIVSERLAITGTEILGAYSQIDSLQRDSKWTRLKGIVESLYWLFPGVAIAAGTDDIERNIIGQFALKLPKSY